MNHKVAVTDDTATAAKSPAIMVRLSPNRSAAIPPNRLSTILAILPTATTRPRPPAPPSFRACQLRPSHQAESPTRLAVLHARYLRNSRSPSGDGGRSAEAPSA